jgi:predicted nucleic acid-binding protein
VKLVVEALESDSLERTLGTFPSQASSVVATVEVPRAVARVDDGAATREATRAVLGQLGLIDLDRAVRERAALLEPARLRSLDAVHLASALALGDYLEALITYDDRLADAAGAVGVTVLSPR